MSTIVSGRVPATGTAVVGALVRVHRRDTGAVIGEGVTADGVTASPSTVLWGTTSTDLNPTSEATITGDGHIMTETSNSSTYVRTDLGKSTGKWYFEIEVTTATVTGLNSFIGILPKASSLTSILSNGRAIRSDGTGYGVTGGSGYSYTARVQIAMDVDALKAWFRVDGGSWFNGGDPVAGTSPSATLYAGEWCPTASSDNNSANHIFTGCFIPSQFENAPPTGFLPIGGPGGVLDAGVYLIGTGSYTDEVQIVCQDPAAGDLENDLIHRTYPVTG